MERKFVGAGLLSGLIAGIVSFVFARVFIEPLVAKAIDYEDVRSDAEAELAGSGHEHGAEIFSRSIQENVGAGVGVVVFALAIGALFAVVFTVAWAFVGRRWPESDPRTLAATLAGVSFVAVVGVPFFVYPPNPPAVGEEDTIGARSGAYLTLTLVSFALAIGAVILAFWLRPRIGGLFGGVAAAVGYLAAVTVTAALLPEFKEIPGPVTDGDRIVAPGFPGQVVADFRVYAIANQVLLWTVFTVGFVALIGVMMRRTATASRRLESVGA
ncbi:cobalt transporter [Gordonia spumicola]|uniref:Cobalt transporter n=1 Tax=Gordonia spumicola TaxID=589161 RepID=A0A7I9VA78_9ACTN|nr:CbtA family protein [Gordonia spumicola]GEE02011.1 cobalt transporter [Gordonia spumicola]